MFQTSLASTTCEYYSFTCWKYILPECAAFGCFILEINQSNCLYNGSSFYTEYLCGFGKTKAHKNNHPIASFFISFLLVQSICATFWVGPSEHIENRLDGKEVLHHTRNVFPPGPSQWTKKLLECIFLMEGADSLYTAIDFHCRFSSVLYRFKQEDVLEACVTIYSTLYTICRAICTGHGTTVIKPRLPHLQNSHTCTLSLPLLLFVILSHKCSLNLISSYNKCIHTPCNIS